MEKVRGSAWMSKTIGAADSVLTGPSVRRRAIMFFPSAANNYAINGRALTALSDGAYMASAAGSAIRFSVEEHGSVVQQEWHAWGGGANVPVSWLEVMD